jgi:hypothetical protein
MEIQLCNLCKHYLFNLKCTAFPEGIPMEILNGENDHSKPFPQQFNDNVFEKDSE